MESASVERAPTPANLAKSNEDEGSRKPTSTVEERRFSAASEAERKEGALAPVKSQAEISQYDTNRPTKKPSTAAKLLTTPNRRKANGATAH